VIVARHRDRAWISPLLAANLGLARAVLDGESPGPLDDWPWIRARAQLATTSRPSLLAARSTFGVLGAAPWLRRATAAPAGTDHRRHAGLSPQELAVARLAAQGLTNREIAQSLFVTPRTVEGHLTSVFRKLDLESREGLAGAIAPAAPDQPSQP
jgi:DNA-binding CsgD family transcriptional regulator